jgi:uncharacterized protein YndB with AHSA1/START domain
MPVVEKSVVIARAPHEVFAYVVEAENLPVWDSMTIEAKQLGEGQPGVGTRTKGVSKLLGRRLDWVSEVTAFEPDALATYTTASGKLTFSATSKVEPTAEGTRFTYRVEAESGLGGVFGRMSDPVVTKALGRIIRANLGNLADLLER